MNGIKGWENKKNKLRDENKRLYRTARESAKGRIIKKTTGRQTWFRKKGSQNTIKNTERNNKGKRTKETHVHRKREHKPTRSENNDKESEEVKENKQTNKELRTAAVLFVENTK